jgi:P-type Mg2+ transporter
VTKTEALSVKTEDLVARLGSSNGGLTEAEASKRLAAGGPNVLKTEARRSVFDLLFNQFKSALVYLLIVASLLSFALHEFSDGIVIAVILIVNAGLGFYQEFRSEKAVEKLQRLVGREIMVVRGGQRLLVEEKTIVPGDMVVLREGDIVPADARLVSVDDFTVNESQLTGESDAVTKSTKGEDSLVFAGSTVEQGEATGVVYATAAGTELGRIAHLSSSTKRTTQFEQSLTSFSNFLVRVTFLTLVVVFIAKLVLIHDFSQVGSMLLFIIALSIAVVPEAMPVIVTVTLSRGALNLAKRHVIAKTLTSVEDLGNINVLCSDKTGTLTENKQTVKKLIADDPKLFQRLAIACLEELDEKRKKSQNSFDQALLRYVPQDIQHEVRDYKMLEELPFDPKARRRRAVATDGHKTYLIESGSVETLLELTHDPRHKEYMKIIAEDGTNGLRHFGIAYKEVRYTTGDQFDILEHEKGLKFVGFVALEDPLRPTAQKTIELAEKLGVGIKILSGDSREVTGYVARQVGLIKDGQRVLTGDDIEKMTDNQLAEAAQSENAFARLNPEQKYRIIKLLKSHGNVVGYQGDGINDAPSLKLADVAIAVSNATDVAKDSADILLLRSDIEVIVGGIRYGRAIFSNINKYIRYTMVNAWGTFFALSVLYLLSVSTLPILPVQVLISNLLTDIPCISIATDNVGLPELMRPSKFNIHALMLLSTVLGSITGVFEILFYAIIKNQNPGLAATSLYLFLTTTALIVIFSVRNKDHFWKAKKLSQPMKISFAVITAISFALIYIPYTARIFSFLFMPWQLLGITLLITFIYFFTLDWIKVWFYRLEAPHLQ